MQWENVLNCRFAECSSSHALACCLTNANANAIHSKQLPMSFAIWQRHCRQAAQILPLACCCLHYGALCSNSCWAHRMTQTEMQALQGQSPPVLPALLFHLAGVRLCLGPLGLWLTSQHGSVALLTPFTPMSLNAAGTTRTVMLLRPAAPCSQPR